MRTVLSLVLLTACGAPPEAPKLRGQVTDAWNKPLAGVTILAEGLEQRATTDAQGNFALPMMTGEVSLKAGMEGYIQDALTLQVDNPAAAPKADIKLYPKPEEDGFYAIGLGGYSKIEEQPVKARGTELESFYGLPSLGKVRVEAPLKVLFHTGWTYDEVQRADLELVELSFTKASELDGAVGVANAEIDLYTKKRSIPVEITALRSRSDYLITVGEELEPGSYAFHTQGTLTPRDQEAFSKVPENLRVAFPVQLR